MGVFAKACVGLVMLFLAPGSATAQSLQTAKSDIAAILVRIETNLGDADAFGAKMRAWQARMDTIKPRVADIARRYAQERATCQGKVEPAEEARRTASCDATFVQLDGLKAQLRSDIVALRDEGLQMQARETARAAEEKQLREQLATALAPLTALCATMPRDAFVRDCHVPAAPGPRTRKIVVDLEAILFGQRAPAT
ncbi:hypothetical protein BH10PSE14_BH10PSE14_19480 [soil metagenome]